MRGVNASETRDVLNVLPASKGFKPLKSQVPAAPALPARSYGAASLRDSTNGPFTFAGTATKLYRLVGGVWTDVSRLVGGNYALATGVGDRWRFEQFGDLVLTVNGTDAPQKFDMSSPAQFSALGGSPPVAKFIGVVANFVVLGNLFDKGNFIRWSGLANAEGWTIGVEGADEQEFFTGGPVTGVVGGEIGYVFQRTTVRRLVYAPGTPYVFQIDEVESGRGCVAPDSIVRIGAQIFYLSGEGFYMLEQATGRSQPIDEGKVREFFQGDLRTGSESSIIATVDPVARLVFWSYISKDNSGDIPDRSLIYDWTLGEWTKANFSVQSWVTYIGDTYTMDTIDSFGGLDDVAISFDNPFWTTGQSNTGYIDANGVVGPLTGAALAATIESNDSRVDGEGDTYVASVTPEIDTLQATVSLAGKSRTQDALVWDMASPIEENGITHQHLAARYVRGRLSIEAGAAWTLAQGLDVTAGQDGTR